MNIKDEVIKAQTWYDKTPEEVLIEIGGSESGLTSDVAKEHLNRFGQNSLPTEKVDSYFKILLRQFQGPLIYILLIASVIVFAMGDIIDGLVILFVLIINALIGAGQEGKAKEKLSALTKLTETRATVMRDSKETDINAGLLVPGDVVVLREGDQVPADGRIISSSSLTIDESALTGESDPVSKSTEVIKADSLVTGDQKNMMWKGTYVTSGFGKAVIVATGINTVIGTIAARIKDIDSEVPLKKSIRVLTRFIMFFMVVVVVVVFFVGIQAGNSVEYMFKTVVALAVSFVPEGLPVVVTLILATGVWRMSERNALVKKLQAVEALGQADVIAVDKTGTITKNQMMISKLYAGGEVFNVTGDGYAPVGELKRVGGEAIESPNHPEIVFAGRVSVLTATASVVYDEEKKEWIRKFGEPTEAALLTFGKKIGFTKEGILREYKQLSEIPFDSNLKYHATINEIDDKIVFHVAGAPEVILKNATQIWKNGSCQPFTDKDRVEFKNNLKEFADSGLRVLALATAVIEDANINPEKMPPLCMVALVGMSDVIRAEAAQAVKDATMAGVKVVMITGDFEDTARSIAAQVGIFKEGERVMTGVQMDELDFDQLAGEVGDVSVFARVGPEHKYKIVKAFQKRGDKIAMTGDGVNDSLSLVAADLGVAMGRSGTDVAKEAADIVLLDDNFASIVAAIEEGRNIYHSIKKVILYLFGTAVGEIVAITGAIFLGFPIPLTPSQIIWLNLVTDGFLVVALGLGPIDKSLLYDKVKRRGRFIVDWLMMERALIMGFVMAGVSLFMFVEYLDEGIVKASTIALTALSVTQWFNVWNVRSERRSIFAMNWFSNKYLLWATAIVVVLQMAVVYLPFMQTIFRTTPLSLSEWVMILGFSTFVFIAEEIRKFLHFVFRKIKNIEGLKGAVQG
ncbi:MAG: ATPase [Parcubacteria group bacterium CG11_big_fil_rev_8_21_14_0_20_39_22]|nr:MAG: ATPase [Parcubacteria group bacterium CG11_big_fil_rev_8_21_14_0_20_39_22]